MFSLFFSVSNFYFTSQYHQFPLSHPAAAIEKLEKIKLEAARIVTCLTKFASKDSLYFETGWETLANRRKNRKLTIFYKIHNKLCPPYLFYCLPPVTSDVNN